MKMTEEEAIAYLRTFNAWRCGDESQEAPTPSTVTEAIRTVCDALEGANVKQTHNRKVIAQLEDYVARLEGARRAVPANLSEFRTDLAKRIRDIPSRLESLGGQRFAYVKLSEVIDTIYAAAPAQPATFIGVDKSADGDCTVTVTMTHGVIHVESVDWQPSTETAGDARDAELLVHHIACALAVEDGYDPDDKACGLYDLRWSGGTEPELVGDAFTMDYLPRAERIAAILAAQGVKS